jgi:hypothetical protein
VPAGPFVTEPAPVQPALQQIDPVTLPTYSTVDQSKYRYLIHAAVRPTPALTPAAGALELFTIRISCDRF